MGHKSCDWLEIVAAQNLGESRDNRRGRDAWVDDETLGVLGWSDHPAIGGECLCWQDLKNHPITPFPRRSLCVRAIAASLSPGEELRVPLTPHLTAPVNGSFGLVP